MSIDDLPYRPCVGVVLLNKHGKIFTGERIDNPGAWQMPQGGVDAGEDLKTAALRELFEETGVKASKVTIARQTKDWLYYDLPVELVPNLWGGQYRGQMQHWFLMGFTGTDADIRLDMHSPEFARWKWSDPADVIREIVPFKRDIYAKIMNELVLTV